MPRPLRASPARAEARALASSLEVEPMLESVVRIAIPQLADFCVFIVNEDDGSVRRISSPSAPPEDSAGSRITVDVEARGTTFGSLTLCFAQSGRRHTAEDVALANELARRAALAIENGRLYRTLRSEQQRLQMALSAGGMGAWEWTVASGRVTWSPLLEAIHGIPEGSFEGTFEAYQEDIYREDRERVLTTIAASLANKESHHLSYPDRPPGRCDSLVGCHRHRHSRLSR